MTKLSTAARKAIPAKSLAEPDKRKYPIENEAHARNQGPTMRFAGVVLNRVNWQSNYGIRINKVHPRRNKGEHSIRLKRHPMISRKQPLASSFLRHTKNQKHMNILVINPGGNSLKADIVSCEKTQRYAGGPADRARVLPCYLWLS